jgi:lipoyl(octanoyl) transferase
MSTGRESGVEGRDASRLPPLLRWLGRVDYEPTWRAMQAYTESRGPDSPDQFWFLEHPPVFTMGMNASEHHLLAPGDIPVVNIDRGGQVTYHGPGQLVVYPLLDLDRLGLGIRELVVGIETAIIETVAGWGINASGRRDAPGVYVDGRKLASIGLRIRRSCSYHGLALNVSMDLEPFARINPCGYQGLQMTKLSELGGPVDLRQVADALMPLLLRQLGIPAESVRWGDRPGPFNGHRET